MAEESTLNNPKEDFLNFEQIFQNSILSILNSGSFKETLSTVAEGIKKISPRVENCFSEIKSSEEFKKFEDTISQLKSKLDNISEDKLNNIRKSMLIAGLMRLHNE
ncbi:MAG: hypothetical protein V4591_05170 [Bdellovibrionota bacterium]